MKTLPRYCDFFPTSRGWYMTLAPKANGGEETADIYGPVNSLCEIQMFLNKFLHPSDYVTVYELCDVPKLAPSGKAIIPIEMPLEPASVLGKGLSNVPARFIVDSRGGSRCLYDTGSGIQFWFERGKIVEATPRDFWRADPVRLKKQNCSILPPTSEKEWVDLVATIVDIFRTERGYKPNCYLPVIIPRLERQPLPLKKISKPRHRATAN